MNKAQFFCRLPVLRDNSIASTLVRVSPVYLSASALLILDFLFFCANSLRFFFVLVKFAFVRVHSRLNGLNLRQRFGCGSATLCLRGKVSETVYQLPKLADVRGTTTRSLGCSNLGSCRCKNWARGGMGEYVCVRAFFPPADMDTALFVGIGASECSRSIAGECPAGLVPGCERFRHPG
jgi:hypothetical protein